MQRDSLDYIIKRGQTACKIDMETQLSRLVPQPPPKGYTSWYHWKKKQGNDTSLAFRRHHWELLSFLFLLLYISCFFCCLADISNSN